MVIFLCVLPVGFSALNDNLTQYFSFDNTTFQWYVDQATSKNITNPNNSNTTITSGKLGNALNISGLGYALTELDIKLFSADHTGYSATQKGYTIQWWSYQTTATGVQYHMYGGDGAATALLGFYANAATNSEAMVRRGTGTGVIGGAMAAKTWYHNIVVVNLYSNNATLYRNGAYVGTVATSTGNPFATKKNSFRRLSRRFK